MFGAGLPTASQNRVACSPTQTTWSVGRVTISTGSDQFKIAALDLNNLSQI